MLTLLINLDRSVRRLGSASDQLERQGISFNRFPAFDGQLENLAELSAYDLRKAEKFYGRPLSSAELGCYKSHLGCVERFLQTDEELCLVLEDDVHVPEGHAATFGEFCKTLNRKNSPDWELVNLGKAPRLFRSPLWQQDEHTVFAAHYFPTTTTALLWNRKGAKAFLATQHEIFAPVDHFLRHLFTRRGTGLALDPPLFIPSGAPSVINEPGVRAHDRPPHFLLREGLRQGSNYLHGALGKLTYLRKKKFL